MRDLVDNPLFQRIAFDPALLAIAQSALGTPPIHVQTSCWWSFPNKIKKKPRD